MTKAGHGVMLRTGWFNSVSTFTPRIQVTRTHTHKDVNAGARHSNSGWEREA